MFSKVFHNAVIRSMVVIEFFATWAYGIITPVFAIFVVESIESGTAEIVGYATAIFWIVKAIVQLPVASFLDKTDGERDDFWAYFIGQFLFGVGSILFIFASIPIHIYLIQALMGAALAINIPALYGVFSRHLDKHYESFEWSTYSVMSYSVATALAGALSGLIVVFLGFKALFTIAAAFFFFSSLLSLFILRPYIAKVSQKIPAHAAMPIGRHRQEHQR